MFTPCMHKQGAVGHVFCLAVLVLGGATLPVYGAAANPLPQASLAWDEGGQSA